jgi:hypothetical protein
MWDAASALSRRNKYGFYVYEMLFLVYLVFFWLYMVHTFGLYATLQETFWENAVCRLPGLLITIAAGWMTTVYVCERNGVDLNKVFTVTRAHTAELVSGLGEETEAVLVQTVVV